jgi:hypothetical protein
MGLHSTAVGDHAGIAGDARFAGAALQVIDVLRIAVLRID